MNAQNRTRIILLGATLLLVGMACEALFPRVVAPGSVEEQVGAGNIKFEGSGNLTYGECMDPTAAVTLHVNVPVKEENGQEFIEPVNPVSVNALTKGAIPAAGGCEKFNLDEVHDWPAKGYYYAKEGKILFNTCSLTDGKAEGSAYLNGEGADMYFEGEYACYAADGSLVYSMAFSVFPVSE